MAKRKKVRSEARFENPDVLPQFIYMEPAESPFDAIVKRGGPYFDSLAETGFRVTRIPAGDQTPFKVRYPWTFIYGPVPMDDQRAWVEETTAGSPCSVIFDVMFPVMRPELLIGTDEAVKAVIDNRDVILANIAAACAVTVPHESWAADLVEVNPNVWWLPDILIDPSVDLGLLDEPDDLDDAVLDDLEDRAETLAVFGIKFAEMMQATFTACRVKAVAEPPVVA